MSGGVPKIPAGTGGVSWLGLTNAVPHEKLDLVTNPYAVKIDDGYEAVVYCMYFERAEAFFKRGEVPHYLLRFRLGIGPSLFRVSEEEVWKGKIK